MHRPGLSTGVILLIAAASGLVGGVVLAQLNRQGPMAEPDDDDSMVEPVAKVLPLGPPAQRDVMAPDVETLEGITPYPGAAPRKLTSRSVVSGLPMKVAWFATQDSPSEVMAFYERVSAADDRMVVTHQFGDRIGYVGWVDRAEAHRPSDGGEVRLLPRSPLHLISVIGQRRETLVLISRTEPSQFFEKPVALPQGVLLPPSAEPPQIIEQAEFSLDRRTIYTRARGLSLEQTKAFYSRELGRAGWSVHDAAEGDGRASLVVKRGSATQVITLAPEGEHTRILLTLDARPAPEMAR